MTLGVGLEATVQNEELFKTKKTKKYRPPALAMPGEQASNAQQVGRFLDGKAVRGKTAHAAGKETTENIFRVLGQYLKGKRSLYGQKMEHARQAFGLMDVDGGGTIDSAEFGTALKRLGFNLTPVQTKQVLDVVDADANGVVDYREFVELLGEEHEPEGRFVAYDPSKTVRGSAIALKEQADHMAPEAAQLDLNTHNHAVSYQLTQEERLQRQAAVLFRAVKQKLADHWSLFGEELDGKVESFFTALDTDESGNIEPGELAAALTRLDLGLTETQVTQMIAEADADGSGDIDLGEWIARFHNLPKLAGEMREMLSEDTVGGSSSLGTIDALAAVHEPRPPSGPPTPASRVAFENAMAETMSVLDAESARQKQRYSRAQAAADQMKFSTGRTRLRPETANTPGVMVSRPWPPPRSAPGSARQPRRWNEGNDVHVESARREMSRRLETPTSPRSTWTVCSARDPRGAARVHRATGAATPSSTRSGGQQQRGQAVEKPLWGVLEWGQNRMFYPGPSSNPAQPPTTLPSGSSMYSEAYQQQQSKDHAHLESRAISVEAGEKGLRRAQFNSHTRFYEARDELIFTKGGLLGSDFGPSSQRLKPWTATGVVPRSSPHFRPGALPPQATPWQVHGKEEAYTFGVDLRQIGQDHPRLDNPLLDYRRDIVDAAQTERIIKHGSTPRCVRPKANFMPYHPLT